MKFDAIFVEEDFNACVESIYTYIVRGIIYVYIVYYLLVTCSSKLGMVLRILSLSWLHSITGTK